jgi:hypothetical protein
MYVPPQQMQYNQMQGGYPQQQPLLQPQQYMQPQ